MPNDLNFCLNGIVWPDRTLHPAVHGELKFLSFCVTKVLYKMVSDHNCDYYLTSHEVIGCFQRLSIFTNQSRFHSKKAQLRYSHIS